MLRNSMDLVAVCSVIGIVLYQTLAALNAQRDHTDSKLGHGNDEFLNSCGFGRAEVRVCERESGQSIWESTRHVKVDGKAARLSDMNE